MLVVSLLLLLGPGSARAALEGCEIFPANNIWKVRVDGLPVDASSDAYVATIGADTGLHPDFGTEWQGAPNGIPYVAVPGNQPLVPVSFQYAPESDPGPYPVPPDAPIEGGPDGEGDRHVLVLDRDACVLYELFYAYPEDAGASWSAGSGAIFDLGSNDLRPAGWTSADAAGLPILPGLVRYEEVASGEIRHALRFTARYTRQAYVWPARHHASSSSDPDRPPMGQRFRLRADFDLASFSPEVRVILIALQRYGMMLADNGSDWYVSGAPDPRWDDDVLRELRQVQGSDFEAVDVSSLQISADSGATPVPEPGAPIQGLTTLAVLVPLAYRRRARPPQEQSRDLSWKRRAPTVRCPFAPSTRSELRQRGSACAFRA